jgi:hypothetical protein
VGPNVRDGRRKVAGDGKREKSGWKGRKCDIPGSKVSQNGSLALKADAPLGKLALAALEGLPHLGQRFVAGERFGQEGNVEEAQAVLGQQLGRVA